VDPKPPDSSAVKATKISVLSGFFHFGKRPASAITAVVPDASSLAPLKMESPLTAFLFPDGHNATKK
jgi:hypothetical protein